MILDSVDFENENIVITAPCWILRISEYERFFKGQFNDSIHIITHNLKRIGFKKVIGYKAVFDDLKCEFTRLDTDGNKIRLGEAHTNTGFIAVFSLDEVLRYDPYYGYDKEAEYGYAVVIRNFTGRVSIEQTDNGTISVVGQGNIDFYSEIME